MVHSRFPSATESSATAVYAVFFLVFSRLFEGGVKSGVAFLKTMLF